jgi:hypothetical protein
MDTLKKAIKVLQRDPDITNTAFGEDELEEQLRLESMNKRREDEGKRRPPPSRDGGDGGNWNQRQDSDLSNRGGGNVYAPP